MKLNAFMTRKIPSILNYLLRRHLFNQLDYISKNNMHRNTITRYVIPIKIYLVTTSISKNVFKFILILKY